MALKIDVSTIQSVYSGKAGKCCCGCAGKHTYATAFADRAGYPDPNVSDRTVRAVCGKIDAAEKPSDEGGHYFAEVGGRWYVAYKAAH